MNYTINSIALAFVSIGVVVLYFTIKNLLPSYFTEKGKNLATKEDIALITKLVESVKYSFTAETEKLKSNLSLLNNVQIGIISEERNAIIDFNEKYFKWINMLLDSSFGNIDDTNDIDLYKYQQSIRAAYNDFLNSETRFSLFIEKESLIQLVHKLKMVTFAKLSPIAPKSLLTLRYINSKTDEIYKSTPVINQVEKLEELLNEREQVYIEFHMKSLAAFQEIVPINKEFLRMSREHIYNLLKMPE